MSLARCDVPIPNALRENVGGLDDGAAWLDRIPERVEEISRRWELRLDPPFERGVSCAWVAPCRTAEGRDAVLKLGFPHMEARDEIGGLAFWQGDPTVELLRHDRDANAMLLEQCRPGLPLSEEPEGAQDEILASLLKRLWRPVAGTLGFRPLGDMVEAWSRSALEKAAPHRRALVEEAVAAGRRLLDADDRPVLLATDLHAGNVLRAEREPWLVIDPKPFVGDRCYDGTQHLLNGPERMRRAPLEAIRRFADLLEVDEARLRAWTFVRVALHEFPGLEGIAERLRE